MLLLSQVFLTCGFILGVHEINFFLDFFVLKGLFITISTPKGTGNQKNLRITLLYDVHIIFLLLISRLRVCENTCIVVSLFSPMTCKCSDLYFFYF